MKKISYHPVAWPRLLKAMVRIIKVQLVHYLLRIRFLSLFVIKIIRVENIIFFRGDRGEGGGFLKIFSIFEILS